MNTLQIENEKIKPKLEIIIVEKLNGRTEKWKIDDTLGQFGEDRIKDKGERIRIILKLLKIL